MPAAKDPREELVGEVYSTPESNLKNTVMKGYERRYRRSIEDPAGF